MFAARLIFSTSSTSTSVGMTVGRPACANSSTLPLIRFWMVMTGTPNLLEAFRYDIPCLTAPTASRISF
ncbi:hypothetical protein DPMN_123944 [Dreissena polymorpha]|uniref:Uncharacterized protein n=1 Tax=Dreissena polymorpha TaxID=45954 RepID=A0A9D4GSK1_DREPO|nr:hypothetical protein DPMN_123944 [Dreissena polymorpha]